MVAEGMPLSSAAAWPAAKISLPQPRVLIARPHLYAQLDKATQAGQMTLIVAPGGSGKTSLVVGWARQAALRIAWYTLDAADRDPHRQLAGLLEAIARLYPAAVAAARAALNTGASGSLEPVVLGRLLGALEQLPLVLVVDDFHHLDGATEAVGLWEHLLRFRPPTLSLIVLSRSVPALGFAALAAFDELLGLGSTDLQFNTREAADLLARHSLDPTQAAQLVARSGGWATGLLLLARTTPNGVPMLRARSDALLRHLGGEILDSLPDRLRTFLLESAALGSLTTTEANVLLQRDDSAALFADAAARGLFLELDGNHYRYHDLFADYLIETLRRDDAARLRRLRRNAALYWEERGDLPRALALLASDDDWDMLASTLDRVRLTLWFQGLGGTILTLVEQLPVEYRTPRLLATCGNVRAQQGEFAKALQLADLGMSIAKTDEEWISAAVLRAQTLLQSRRNEEALQASEVALEVAERIGHAGAIVRMQETAGTTYFRLGQFAKGRENLLQVLAFYRQQQNTQAETIALLNLATFIMESGHVVEGEGYLREIERIQQGLTIPTVTGETHYCRALLLILTGQLAAVPAALEAALALAHDAAYPLLECTATALLAEYYAAAGRATQAEQTARQALELGDRVGLIDVRNDAQRARIAAALLRRDRTGARRLLDEARPLTATSIERAQIDLLDGTLALRSRAYTRTVEILGPAAAQCATLSRPQYAARAYLLRAEALLALGMRRRAADDLNAMAALVLPLGCQGFLLAVARFTPMVLEQRSLFRRLHRSTHDLLDYLATQAATPVLTLVSAADADDPPPPPLELSPFGQGSLTLAGNPLTPDALPHKARELLFFVAAHDRPRRRDELLNALWGGMASAQQALWEASRHLRRVLGQYAWVRRGGVYVLDLPFTYAGRHFADLVTLALGDAPPAKRLEAAESALALLGDGGYLEWCDSPWVESERARLALQIQELTVAAATLYLEVGRPREAIAISRRAIALNDLDDEPRALLLRALVAAGDKLEALAEYRRYRRLLREELGADPSAALRTLAAQIRASD